MVAWEALDALSHQLELCKIGADSRVVVVLDAADDADRTSLIRAAVARTGAEAIQVQSINSTGGFGDDFGLITAVVDDADLVIVTSAGRPVLAGSNPHQILELAPIAPDLFPPHINLQRRVNLLVGSIGDGDALRISDATGTNLTVDLTRSHLSSDHGVVTPEQPQAIFPAGWVGIEPAAHTVSGEVVLMPGDGNRSRPGLMSSPVLLRIIDDHISAIEGESTDADVIRTQLEYAADPSAYGVARITVGMNPGPTVSGPFDERLIDPTVGRLLAGVIGISFGENLTADRPCPQHVEFALPSRTVTIDGLPVVRAGTLDGDFAPDVYERPS